MINYKVYESKCCYSVTIIFIIILEVINYTQTPNIWNTRFVIKLYAYHKISVFFKNILLYMNFSILKQGSLHDLTHRTWSIMIMMA